MAISKFEGLYFKIRGNVAKDIDSKLTSQTSMLEPCSYLEIVP